MVIDLWHHISITISEMHGIQCVPCSSQIVSEMLPEIHILEKCDFLKPKVHSNNQELQLCTAHRAWSDPVIKLLFRSFLVNALPAW